MLDDAILEEFINGFYGYGNLNAPFWFIGMEEGGGSSVREINTRIETWRNRGSKEVEDLFEYHCAIGITQFFGRKAKLQTTWNKIIRVVLSAQEQNVDTDKVRDYQNRLLARKNGETCILELLPLPSPNSTSWLYKDCSQLDFLRSREEYRRQVTRFRIPAIRNKVLEHKPKAVVFYGISYKDHWTEIASIDAFSEIKNDISYRKQGSTIFICSQHPASKGITSEYFHRIGNLIKDEINL